ncbi:MAG: hypothetical protein R3E53_17835 [Myxococcota bacterium]
MSSSGSVSSSFFSSSGRASLGSLRATRRLLPLVAGIALVAGVAGAQDVDHDGLLDSFEVQYGLDPADADENGNGRVDGQDDFDADGLGNAAEAAVGTSPIVADSDADGLLDGAELGRGSSVGRR